jgi:predicted lipid-binding transport protein (Tim44 family)
LLFRWHTHILLTGAYAPDLETIMSKPSLMTRHSTFLVLAFTALLALAPNLAEARLGDRSSMGSRGSRTYEAPAPTQSAPMGARPMERSMTPNSTAPNTPPYAPPYAPQNNGFFGRGLFGGFSGGLLGGLLGAGLFGLLFGNGLLGGMGGMGSLFGLIIQIAVLYFVVKWVWAWFGPRARYAGPEPQAQTGNPFQHNLNGGMGGTMGGTMGSTMGASAQSNTRPLTLQSDDFTTFEHLLVEIQTAFGNENLDAVRSKVTPEMASYFSEQIADNARKGVVNAISDVHFVHGDLSEAWSEGADDYATVSLRYTLIDVIKERASGRIIEGNPSVPDDVTEFWTFRRPSGSSSRDWHLSAIQQQG